MNISILIFFIFKLLLLFSAVLAVTHHNPIKAIIALILSFINAASLLLMLQLEFLALVFVVVYVGAIAVLFLFIIMMMNLRLSDLNEKLLNYLPLTVILGLLFVLQVTVTLRGLNTFYLASRTEDWIYLIYNSSDMETLGYLMYTSYFSFFIIAGFILLIAMICAIVLTLRDKGCVYQTLWQEKHNKQINSKFTYKLVTINYPLLNTELLYPSVKYILFVFFCFLASYLFVFYNKYKIIIHDYNKTLTEVSKKIFNRMLITIFLTPGLFIFSTTYLAYVTSLQILTYNYFLISLHIVAFLLSIFIWILFLLEAYFYTLSIKIFAELGALISAYKNKNLLSNDITKLSRLIHLYAPYLKIDTTGTANNFILYFSKRILAQNPVIQTKLLENFNEIFKNKKELSRQITDIVSNGSETEHKSFIPPIVWVYLLRIASLIHISQGVHYFGARVGLWPEHIGINWPNFPPSNTPPSTPPPPPAPASTPPPSTPPTPNAWHEDFKNLERAQKGFSRILRELSTFNNGPRRCKNTDFPKPRPDDNFRDGEGGETSSGIENK